MTMTEKHTITPRQVLEELQREVGVYARPMQEAMRLAFANVLGSMNAAVSDEIFDPAFEVMLRQRICELARQRLGALALEKAWPFLYHSAADRNIQQMPLATTK
ncbi:MAG: hypothetical protein JWM00_440 [Candidatus Saccharibacteria bacterium]|nr:hypothetical protein [Candidatus Saccharibacteria bacterium]